MKYLSYFNTTDPGPEAQDELSPLTVAHQLWDQLRHHGNKLFQHPIVIHQSLLHNLPHCSRQELQGRGQEPQITGWEIITWRERRKRKQTTKNSSMTSLELLKYQKI